MNKLTALVLGKHFDTSFAAPDGIKKLRELILTLAMQGKLVPQNPQDQPASKLLKEIEAEKKRLVKEGKIKAGSREDANNAKEARPEEVPTIKGCDAFTLKVGASLINRINAITKFLSA